MIRLPEPAAWRGCDIDQVKDAAGAMTHSRTGYISALGHDWLTPLYDPLIRLTTRELTFKRQLVAQAHLQHGERLLDIGCGTGTLWGCESGWPWGFVRSSILQRSLCLLTLVGVAFALVPAATAQQIGTDIAGLNLCLYGDCEARGTYAADPFGMVNPGTLPVGMMMYLPHGVVVSGSYFRLNAGGIGINIESPSITVGADPWVFQVNVVYADGGGAIRSVPGADLSLQIAMVRLATGVDLGRTALGLTGLSVGLLAGVPGTSSDLHVASSGFTVVDSHESHEIGLTPGVDWHTGVHDWFSVGAFLNAERHHESTRSIDPLTYQPVQTFGTLNAWFARAGLSVLPFVPLGLAEESSPASEFLREVRVASDVEYRNISSPGEPTRSAQAGYFGADLRLLPDAWNPVSGYMRPYLIGGVDTNGGWGVGAGIYGNGVLEFLSCNPAYSSRPLASSLADRVNIWAATCAVMVPF